MSLKVSLTHAIYDTFVLHSYSLLILIIHFFKYIYIATHKIEVHGPTMAPGFLYRIFTINPFYLKLIVYYNYLNGAKLEYMTF